MIEYTVRVYDDRTEWRSNGRLHRTDGPAVEYASGTKQWWLNDKRHRLDGPAVEYANGTKEWWLNDEFHRLDGPAREFADGSKEWWLNDKYMSEKEFNQRTQVKELTINELEALLGYKIKVIGEQ